MHNRHAQSIGHILLSARQGHYANLPQFHGLGAMLPFRHHRSLQADEITRQDKVDHPPVAR